MHETDVVKKYYIIANASNYRFLGSDKRRPCAVH